MVVVHPETPRYLGRPPLIPSFLVYGFGFFMTLSIASYFAWGSFMFWQYPDRKDLMIMTGLTYILGLSLLHRLSRFPTGRGVSVTIFSAGASFVALYLVLKSMGLETPTDFLSAELVMFVILILGAQYIGAKGRRLQVGLVTKGRIAEADRLNQVVWVRLQEPRALRVDAIAADLHNNISREWLRYLADSSLRGVPVYHIATLYELFTGRVSLRYIHDSVLLEIKPSPTYLAFKWAADILLVLLAAPIAIPIIILTALAIRLESPGPVLFKQTRVGLGGQPFQMIKFRSMRVDADKDGAQFAVLGDRRITRVGRIIRKFRIDELPQLYNILRGDMSWIGPRPEQVLFVELFSQQIPFYGYRHTVRPGITGWAQIKGGYAADTEATQEKLMYDLYYVKHFSFWLDFLVVIQTVRTILTGFGAR